MSLSHPNQTTREGGLPYLDFLPQVCTPSMKAPDVTLETLRPVLHALLQRSHEAWCFVATEDPAVQYCSQEFVNMWRLPQGESLSGAAILVNLNLTAETFLDSARQLGLEKTWLTDIINSRESVIIRRNDGLSVRAIANLVFDRDGKPIGRLVFFEVVTNSQSLLSLVSRFQAAQARLTLLSPREREILKMVYDGFTNKAIAIRAKISDKTVEKHRANLMHKLGVRNVVELARLVTEAEIADVTFQLTDPAES